MNDANALKVQLAATERAIYDTYQRFHHQDPTLRPKEAGQLGRCGTFTTKLFLNFRSKGSKTSNRP